LLVMYMFLHLGTLLFFPQDRPAPIYIYNITLVSQVCSEHSYEWSLIPYSLWLCTWTVPDIPLKFYARFLPDNNNIEASVIYNTE
jgi:hypothetical protein